MYPNHVIHTPWGTPDQIEELAEGIWQVSTPSHGGIVLSEDRAEMLPEGLDPFTRDYRYWEEDCDWPVPLLAFYKEVIPAPNVLILRMAMSRERRKIIDDWHATLTSKEGQK